MEAFLRSPADTRTLAQIFFRNAARIIALTQRSHREDAMKIRPLKPSRATIDLSDETLARGWTKKLGKSKEEIAAAIEKVGDNAETVKRELGYVDGEKA
jgi:3-isopropylmalate dehydratase small subunit